MSILAQIKGLFTPHAVALTLERLQPLETTMINTLFPDNTEHPFPTIGIGEFENVVGTLPVVRRDGQPIPYQGKGDDVNIYAPRPIKPSVKVTASELNDLKAIWGNQISTQQFVDRKIDKLRNLVRNTTEAMASVVATTGKLAWPSRTEGGGFETYELDFGGVERLDLPTKWTAASPPPIQEVYAWLSKLKRAVTKAGGGGGKFCFLAGEEAFGLLLAFAENWKSTAQGSAISLNFEAGKVIIGGFEVTEVAEEYQDPLDNSQWIPKIDPKCFLGYSSQRTGRVFYLAIDSISSENAAVPFYVVVEAEPGDGAINLIAQAKPVPVADLRAMIISEIVA